MLLSDCQHLYSKENKIKIKMCVLPPPHAAKEILQRRLLWLALSAVSFLAALADTDALHLLLIAKHCYACSSGCHFLIEYGFHLMTCGGCDLSRASAKCRMHLEYSPAWQSSHTHTHLLLSHKWNTQPTTVATACATWCGMMTVCAFCHNVYRI